MQRQTIKVTILFENIFWVGIFERSDAQHYAVARHIFGDEPNDSELYEFISQHYGELNFTEPQDFVLEIKRMNPKRKHREVRKEMEKLKSQQTSKESMAQETLRLELEKNKKLGQARSKVEKEQQAEEKFMLKQLKRKQKHRGH
jgi:hypothetical protein